MAQPCVGMFPDGRLVAFAEVSPHVLQVGSVTQTDPGVNQATAWPGYTSTGSSWGGAPVGDGTGNWYFLVPEQNPFPTLPPLEPFPPGYLACVDRNQDGRLEVFILD